jgi:hypothetical protein
MMDLYTQVVQWKDDLVEAVDTPEVIRGPEDEDYVLTLQSREYIMRSEFLSKKELLKEIIKDGFIYR